MTNRRYHQTPRDIEKLENLRGREFTDKELKNEFGYSPSTYILDTFLAREHFIDPIPSVRPRRWRVH